MPTLFTTLLPRMAAEFLLSLGISGSVLAPLVGQKLGLISAPPPALVHWNVPGFRRVTALLEAELQRGPFLVGDRLTLADFSVAGMLTYARAAEFPFGSLPNLGAWYERIERMDAWRLTATPPWG